MESIAKKEKTELHGANLAWIAFSSILGSIFLSFCAEIAIPMPLNPVPLSLQSLGIGLLSLTLGKRAPLAVGAYLIEATLGFPVLAGGVSNPLWMIGPRAGYLLGFLIASGVMGYLFEKMKTTHIKNFSTFLLGEAIILFLGTFWLSLFLGFQQAFFLGVLPFIPGALLKSFALSSSFTPFRWLQSRLLNR